MAFRPGSHIGEVTPDPSIDVSASGEESDIHQDSIIQKDLDKPIDLTGHILSPFYQREIIYQDCKFHSIAHLLCYRYAIANDQKTFATGIRKWSRQLVEFPTPKFTTTDETQQWLEILTDIYTYLCTMDGTFRSTLINTGPHPFTLQCRSPWGYVLSDLDTCPRTDLVSDVLISVRVSASSDRLPQNRWLSTKRQATHDTRNVRR